MTILGGFMEKKSNKLSSGFSYFVAPPNSGQQEMSVMCWKTKTLRLFACEYNDTAKEYDLWEVWDSCKGKFRTQKGFIERCLEILDLDPKYAGANCGYVSNDFSAEEMILLLSILVDCEDSWVDEDLRDAYVKEYL